MGFNSGTFVLLNSQSTFKFDLSYDDNSTTSGASVYQVTVYGSNFTDSTGKACSGSQTLSFGHTHKYRKITKVSDIEVPNLNHSANTVTKTSRIEVSGNFLASEISTSSSDSST